MGACYQGVDKPLVLYIIYNVRSLLSSRLYPLELTLAAIG